MAHKIRYIERNVINMEKTLNIVHLFPEIMNLYGDVGNIVVLKKRCQLRGIDANIISVNIDDEIDLKDADIVFLGGGSEKDLKKAGDKLLSFKNEFISFRDTDGVMLFVCDSCQLLGNYYFLQDEKTEGLGLCDMRVEKSQQGDKKLMGNVCIDTQFGVIAGFENHTEKIYIGDDAMPLGTVIRGYGNNGKDKKEGIWYKNIFGTNLHGPLLPKNPEFADALIKKAILRKYNEDIDLLPINDELAMKAKAYVLNLKKEEL